MLSSERCFTHETNDVERAGEDIAQVLRLRAVGFAEPGRTFQIPASLVGVAAFCVAETTDTQFPGVRIDLQIPSQADIVVFRQGGIDDDAVPQGVLGVSVGTGECSGTLFVYPVVRDEVWGRVSGAP